MRILGNDDCPLRLVEAKVKDIPGPLFTNLTGRTTNLATVSSVPEATLVNASGQTITKFYLAVRDPHSRSVRGLIQTVALKPAEIHAVKREHFARAGQVTAADANGGISRKLVVPGLESEESWIQFAPRADLFITVVKVDFENGGSWIIREEGEVR